LSRKSGIGYSAASTTSTPGGAWKANIDWATGTFGCSPEKLKSEAKITEADARAIALSKVPDGTIKEAELEREHGKLIWSFDVARPGTKDITEVNVDAKSGVIVAVDVETPKAQAKEKDEDEKKEK